MAETTTTTGTTAETTQGHRKTLIGEVVSTKMAKTIVVEVNRQKAHPFYKRVVKRSKSSMPTTRMAPRNLAMWSRSKRRARCRS